MAVEGNVAKTVTHDADLEACVEQVFGCVAHAILGCDADHVNQFGFQQAQHFGERLPGGRASWMSPPWVPATQCAGQGPPCSTNELWFAG